MGGGGGLRAAEPHAAQLLAAGGVAARQARLVAHADLAHVDALVEFPRQLAYQVAEVHTVLSSEIKDDLFPAEEKLHADRLDVQAAFLHEFPEYGHGLLALGREVLGALDVLVRGDAHDRSQVALALQLGVGDREGVGRGQAELSAALGGNDDVVAGLRLASAGQKPQVLGVEMHADGDYGRHVSVSLSSSSMPSTASRGSVFFSTRRMARPIVSMQLSRASWESLENVVTASAKSMQEGVAAGLFCISSASRKRARCALNAAMIPERVAAVRARLWRSFTSLRAETLKIA